MNEVHRDFSNFCIPNKDISYWLQNIIAIVWQYRK